jgi:uncharacterized protein
MSAGEIENQDCIIMFMRAPKLGQVKTRLSLHLEQNLVLDLYRMFVLDTLDMVTPWASKTLIFVEPAAATADVAKWLGGDRNYIGQEGKDLGERMENAFSLVFSRGYHRAVLIGTDTPDLPGTVLAISLDRLQASDAVIGPSTDGGYYLIGLSGGRIPSGIFASKAWGSDTVYSDTVATLSESNCDFHVLPEWADIDQLQDLGRFLTPDAGTNTFGRRTRSWVHSHRETLEQALVLAHG